MKKILISMACLLVFAQLAIAQSVIRGRVVENDGDAITGASVRVKGTNRGTITDNSGGFGISASNGDELQISSVGFKTLIVAAENGMVVKLVKDNKTINEVVVTALGIKRNKADLGYAATKVTGSEVTNTRQSNVFNALSGKVAGLDIKQNNQMGGSTNIVIRGYKSLGGSNQALIVVDGIPFDNSNTNTTDQRTARGGYDYGNAAADINPDDIASINVLKGPAATALYGSRGANGVILIETKKGKKGFGLTYSSGFSFGQLDKSTFVKYQKQYGAGYFNSFRTAFDVNGDGINDTMARTNHDASFGPAFDPNKNVYTWESLDPNSPKYLQKQPWVAAANDPSTFFVTPMNFSNSVVLTAGNDKTNYKVAYTRNDEKGYLPNSQLTKNLFSVSMGHNISDKLIATMSANTSITTGLGRFGTGYNGNNLMTNFRQWWQTNVDIKTLEEAFTRNEEVNSTWNYNNFNNLTPAYWDNPYWVRRKNYQNDGRTRFFGNTGLTYNVNSWLNILGRVSIDNYFEQQEERHAVGSQQVDQVPRYQRFDRTFREMNYDLIATANKDLNNDLKLGVSLGANFNSRRINEITSSTNGGLNIPNVYTLSNSLNQVLPPTEFASKRDIRGLFATANLGYKGYLFLDLTGRNDVSSTLPSGNNSYYYPSVSAAYLISKHLKLPNWVSYGKIRGSYAGVGADAPFAATKDYFIANTSFGSNPLFTPQNTKANPSLKPERTNSSEVGLEWAFLKNRIVMDLGFYNAKSINQILAVPVSTASGYSRKFINAGDITNKGIELALSLKPVLTKNFSWDVNLNWTRNRNKVVALADGVDNILLGDFQGGVTINAALGRPFGEIRGSDFIYLNGKKLIDTTSGLYQMTTSFNETIGNINPDWTGGITNIFRYKNASLSFLVDARKGGSVFSLDQYYGVTTGIYEYSVGTNTDGTSYRKDGIVFDGVKPDGSVNDIKASYDPFMTFPNAYAVYDASFVKLREVTLGYSLPTSIFKGSKLFKGIDLSLFGRNLAILYKNVPYSDPEDSQSAGNLQGIQSGAYPLFRMMGVNARFNF
jgi:TonB-linked SusC/RagA family outer membrane protein